MRAESRVPSGSLRRRVVLSVVALLFVVLVSLGILVDVILARRLHTDLKARLVDRADFAAVLSAGGTSGQQLVDQLNGQGIVASLTSDGQVYVGQNQVPDDPPGGRPRGGPGGGRPALPQSVATPTISLSEHGSQLSAEVDLGDATLLLTTSEADIDHTLTVLRTVELIAGSITLLVGAALSFTVVSTALSPLRRMAELADRIRAGDRGQRLRPRNPNTDLGRTAAALDGMLDSLESAEAGAQHAEIRMRRFLADASHDLRTPLAVMLAGAEQLLRSDPGRVQRERRLVELIREGQRAGRLVDDLLLMARLDDHDPSAALHYELVELSALVLATAHRLQTVLRDRQLSVDVPGPPVYCLGDPDRLTRVLGNLLENARSATAPGGQISLELRIGPGRAIVDVRDDGRGVPDEERTRVFDRFVRLDEPRSSNAGSGLGLPIARAIARAHEGELSCLPSERGAHFRLELPAVRVGVPAADPVLI